MDLCDRDCTHHDEETHEKQGMFEYLKEIIKGTIEFAINPILPEWSIMSLSENDAPEVIIARATAKERAIMEFIARFDAFMETRRKTPTVIDEWAELIKRTKEEEQ